MKAKMCTAYMHSCTCESSSDFSLSLLFARYAKTYTNMGDDTDLKIPRIAIITLNENKYYYKNYCKSKWSKIDELGAHLWSLKIFWSELAGITSFYKKFEVPNFIEI